MLARGPPLRRASRWKRPPAAAPKVSGRPPCGHGQRNAAGARLPRRPPSVLDVLCHRMWAPAALAEAPRCLRPGAASLFNLPAYDWLLSAHDRRVHNVRRFTGGQARALLAGRGFRVLRRATGTPCCFP